jgi:hypothetical protein
LSDRRTPPILFRWDGEHFTPANAHWILQADRAFVAGQVYPLESPDDRSDASHRHYFASVNEAWMNLPEGLAKRFPSAEHLRKWALIRAGYYDERSIVCASEAEAQRLGAFIKPLDDYAVVIARDSVVIVYTAKSQRARAMDKQEFHRSKDAVLDIIAGLIGTSAGTLANAGEAA